MDNILTHILIKNKQFPNWGGWVGRLCQQFTSNKNFTDLKHTMFVRKEVSFENLNVKKFL